MYRSLGNVKLRTGEPVESGVVINVDSDWGPKIQHLLGHKSEPWGWQVRQCLNRSDLGISSFYYILSRDGRPFANICTFEANGVGIFGHVYTVPEERRKGAADILNGQVVKDFAERKGKALYLGTTFDSPAYHLYARHGFVGVEADSGYMTWVVEGRRAFERACFAPGPATIEPLAFCHWPALSALTMMEHPARLRVLSMGTIRPASVERGVLVLLKDAQERNAAPRGLVAVSERTRMPVALACCYPDPWFGTAVDVLDVFYAPGFETVALTLTEAMSRSEGRKIVAYTDGTWPDKERTLASAGFARGPRLPRHLKSGQSLLDITVWEK